MKITFDSPVVLSFAFISLAVLVLSETVFPGFAENYFATGGRFNPGNPLHYFQSVSHVFGHRNWEHLISNFSFILVVGPILEKKYGAKNLIIMIAVTAVVTAILNALFFNTGLYGASGIVFMMILLGSLVNFRSGTIPLTFILILVLYLGREIYAAISQKDQISQFAHIVGGLCGMLFGFGMSGAKAK
ncbi:MAG: rhomboid family intramembrane serine protease [Bacteroidota bacterium]